MKRDKLIKDDNVRATEMAKLLLEKTGLYDVKTRAVGKKTILIVDDNVEACQMARMTLEGTGLYEVSVCNRGWVAFQVVSDTRPDLVLLDIVLPHADGVDIANMIRQDKNLASTGIIFMTGLVSEQEMASKATIGGHPFIPKPISAEILIKRVKRFFEKGN